MNQHGQTVCLCMIVKNEAPVIRRCLDSVLPLIDSWVIVDTGSTDGTQEIVREHLSRLPGDLVERPWVDFAHNRSQALALARGRSDYLLVIDADEVMESEPGFRLPPLTADSYNLEVAYGSCSYPRKQLVRNDLAWRYEGVVHEYIRCDEARSEAFLKGLRTVPHRDGARARDPQTYRRDALLLEKALLDDPNNARYVFYLAQSYRDAGELELASRHYQRRSEMGGWAEEVWYSKYQIAQIEQRLERPWPQVMASYLAAFQSRPDRAEPLFRIGMYYQYKDERHLAHLFFARAMEIPAPSHDRLFVERAIYDFQLPLEYAVACYYVGRHAEAIATNNRLLRSSLLPAYAVEQVIRNRRFSVDALTAKGDGQASPASLKVVVPLRDPGPELDECVESLQQQEEGGFNVVFLDHGSAADPTARLPLDDRRFELIRVPATTRDSAVRAWLAGCAPGDVVLRLDPADRLADRKALARVARAFADPGCTLYYAQHRLSDGGLGATEPAESEEAFRERGPRLAGRSPIAFRAALAQSLASDEALDAVWSAAGLARARFDDNVLTIAGRGSVPPRTSMPPATAIAVGSEWPLISCLMVTRDRVALARRAILSFAEQTYPRRELVIVTDGNERFRRSLETWVSALGLANVRLVCPGTDGLPLGHLRNISLDAARGEILCQWDDDDYSHPERLALQAAHMFRRGARACFMTDHLQYIEERRAVFWIDWTGRGTWSGKEQLLPGTVMMLNDPRFRYPEEGPYARLGEDSVFLSSLYAAVPVAHMTDMGHLYLYQYHGRNTWSREHHLRLSACSAPRSFIQERGDRIRDALRHYPIARPAMVAGRDGLVFVVA